jgi:hypothetical protein
MPKPRPESEGVMEISDTGISPKKDRARGTLGIFRPNAIHAFLGTFR